MKRLFVFLVLFIAGQAWASFPATLVPPPAGSCTTVGGCTWYTVATKNDTTINGNLTFLSPTQAEACSRTSADAATSYIQPNTVTITNLANCSFTVTGTQNGSPFTITKTGWGYGTWPVAKAADTYSCPSGSTLSGTSCTCTAPLVQSGASCVSTEAAKCQAKSGTLAGNFQAPYTGGGLGGNYSYLCDGGCTVNVAYDFAAAGLKTGAGKFTGSSCSGDPNSLGTSDGSVPTAGGTSTDNPIKPGAPARTPCKSTEYAGEINGVWTCVKPAPGSTQTAKPTTGSSTTTNAAGDQVRTDTDKQTTCTAGTCTTTTTTTITNLTTGATSTGTQTDTKDQTSFCEENPSLSICKEAKFSGSCSASFACSGDAIQCAMAQEQHKRNCQMLEPDTDPNSAVNKALAGNDPGNVDAMKAAAAAAPVGVGSFDFNGRGWSRACPQDPTFVLPWAGGREWSLPFSKLCTPLGLAADVAVALTALGCALFVLRVPQG